MPFTSISPSFVPVMTQSPPTYTPPPFADRLTPQAPRHRLNLAMRPTPIEPWDLSSISDIPSSITFHIKRDDQTGGPTSGNKIRKLEFLLAEAVAQNCTTIITAGGIQSNHARATVVAAKRLGMKTHVFLRTRDLDVEKLGADGNLLFHKMLGVNIHLIKPVPFLQGMLPKMNALKETLEKQGERVYMIGIGGSDNVGLWGYVECWNELIQQNVDRFTDVVFATGSGGTASGLAIGNYLTGSKVRIHAVTVCDTPAYFYDHLDDMLKHIGLGGETTAREILHIHQAKGRGYAVSTDEELELGLQIARNTGIMLDPVYTLKAMYGLIRELRQGNDKFGDQLLFVHTGGIFGLFDRRIEPYLDSTLTTPWS